MTKPVVVTTLIGMLVSLVSAIGYTIPVDQIKGPSCIMRNTKTNQTFNLSPALSQYNVIITDGLAHVRLTQKFINNAGDIDDIVYVFPLPHEASVHAMAMEYRSEIYRAEIFERAQAQNLYDSVVAAGGVAALLLQDRPNVFQQRLANIAYGDSAYVRIEMSLPLKYNAGEYEFSMPTMIGERYQSSGATPVSSSGTLWNPPEDREGQRLQINVLVQAGFPVAGLSSPTHELELPGMQKGRPILEARGCIGVKEIIESRHSDCAVLKNLVTFPNSDFVLRFKRTMAQSDFTLASHLNANYGKGHFAFALFPDDSLFAGERQSLEIVLLIDISGSQGGWPLQKEKEISQEILTRLRPTDRLCVLAFSDNLYWAFGKPDAVEASAQNISIASRFINSLHVSGGTQLLSGVKAALATPTTSEHERYYIFLTDGFITNESAILEAITTHPSSPTIFTFGAGNSLNRYFLERCADAGNGYATQVTQEEDAAAMVDPAWEKIEGVQMENVSVAFGGAEVDDLVMPRGNRLYKGSPLWVFGTYEQGGDYVMTVTGYRGGSPVTLNKQVSFADGFNANRMLPQVWAKQMIGQLRLAEGTTQTNKQQIIDMSVTYQVLSDYTAFLAMNPEMAVGDNAIGGDMEARFTATKVYRLALARSFALFIVNGKLVFGLPEGVSMLGFKVYDLLGKLVYEFNSTSALSTDRIVWDGRLADGSCIGSGRYIVKVALGNGMVITRAIGWK